MIDSRVCVKSSADTGRRNVQVIDSLWKMQLNWTHYAPSTFLMWKHLMGRFWHVNERLVLWEGCEQLTSGLLQITLSVWRNRVCFWTGPVADVSECGKNLKKGLIYYNVATFNNLASLVLQLEICGYFEATVVSCGSPVQPVALLAKLLYIYTNNGVMFNSHQ